MTSPVPRTIVVTAAVIEEDDRFLLTRRQRGVHLEGFWEFPGGKCEPGESLAECLAREIREELAVEGIVMYSVFAWIETHFTRWAFRSSMSAAA